MSLAPLLLPSGFNSARGSAFLRKLYWYKAGTLIAKETYADSAQTVLHYEPDCSRFRRPCECLAHRQRGL